MKRALLVALVALTAVTGCSSKKRVPEEVAKQTRQRENFALATLLDAGASRAAGVSSREDLVFEDGFGKILYGEKGPTDDVREHAFRWMGKNAHLRLRRHGNKRMRFGIGGWVNNKVLHTSPVITAYFNGHPVGFTPPIVLERDSGHYRIDAAIEPDLWEGREWGDLNLIVSSVAYHWADPPNLNVVLTYRVDWDAIP